MLIVASVIAGLTRTVFIAAKPISPQLKGIAGQARNDV
ncbi:hypothetical protein R80B4_03288 [Fibrobacteres bacterium R8-0-B4]